MGKPGKNSGNGLLRVILGLIFVIIIILGINYGIKDDKVAEEPQQTEQKAAEQAAEQSGGTDLEAQIRAEETVSEQESGPADSSPDEVEKPASENLTVHFLDVGQGDSILLEYNGSTMLIDAGERDQGSGISAYLNEQDISSLDYIVATHPHSDHIGGMAEILNSFQVEQFIDSGFPHTSKTYENMLTTIDEKNIPFEVVEKGEEIEFDPAVDVEVLNPGPEYSKDLNENSVVLKVSYGEVSFLLMGDAGLETEENLMDAGYDLDSDILKVGHHASRSGSGEAFISAVSPEISIIEVGADNDYGHPHAEILQRLQTVSSVYRTDLDGSIIITTDGDTYTIRTQKNGSGSGIAETVTAESEDDSSSVSMVTRETETEVTEAVVSEPEVTETEEVEEVETDETGSETGSISSSAETAVYISDLSLQDEWVAVTNKETLPVSLKGWKIEDEGSKHTYTFSSFTLDSQATVTLYTGEGTDTASELYWESGSSIWNNDGDAAYLYDASGELIDELEK